MKIIFILLTTLCVSMLPAQPKKIALWGVGSVQEYWVNDVHHRVLYHLRNATVGKTSSMWELDTLGKVNRVTKAGNTLAKIHVFKLVDNKWQPVGIAFSGLYSDEPKDLIKIALTQ